MSFSETVIVKQVCGVLEAYTFINILKFVSCSCMFWFHNEKDTSKHSY